MHANTLQKRQVRPRVYGYAHQTEGVVSINGVNEIASRVAAPIGMHVFASDPHAAEVLSVNLTEEGFEPHVEVDPAQAVRAVLTEMPKLVLLDLHLEGANGYSVCKQLRERDYNGVIVIISAIRDEMSEVVAFDVGANDYLTKPIRPRALAARLRAHLRVYVHTANHSPVIEIGELTIDGTRRQVSYSHQTIETTTAEFELLWVLAENAGKVLSRSVLYERIYGIPYDGLDRSLDLRVSRLRKKLRGLPHEGEFIKSIRGVGYLMIAGE